MLWHRGPLSLVPVDIDVCAQRRMERLRRGDMTILWHNLAKAKEVRRSGLTFGRSRYPG